MRSRTFLDGNSPGNLVNNEGTANIILHVEGKEEHSIDAEFIYQLFENNKIFIRVQPFGPSMNIRAAAEAHHPHNPNFYFLIDRDHHEDDRVEQSWKNFPDSKQNNLLLWRYRELENYFLDPEYLEKSSFLKTGCNQVELGKRILKFANQRLHFDTTNLVITKMREDLKVNWIKHFTDPSEFPDPKTALQKLKYLTEYEEFKRRTEAILNHTWLEATFNHYSSIILDNDLTLTLENKNWLKILSGKPILNSLISECMEVPKKSGNEARRLIMRQLANLPLNEQPLDFQNLVEIFQTRILTR